MRGLDVATWEPTPLFELVIMESAVMMWHHQQHIN
jgi:hypothetical protein